MEHPLRLLIISEQNNPDWISVPLVGYRHSEALAYLHDVHLVTHIRNKPAFESKLRPFKRVTYIDLGWFDQVYSWIFNNIFKGDFGSQALTAMRLPFYLIFEWLAWRQVKTEFTQKRVDCVLRLTPVAPVLPSPWARWLARYRIPFVIGPINGGLPFPPGYEQAERQKEWVSSLRNVYRYMPYAKSTFAKSTAIIAGSSQTFGEFIAFKEKLFLVPENGITNEMILEKGAIKEGNGPLNLVFAGRLVPYKACDMALKGAAKLLRAGKAQFTVVGDGVERTALEHLAQQLGVGHAVSFVGMVSHQETMKYFSRADILLFPSVREFGGGVVFEALAAGTVPIVADYGGPGDIVHAGIGFKIPLAGEEKSIQFIESTLDQLNSNRDRLAELSRAGQTFARDCLTWEGKAKITSEILLWATGGGQKPNLVPAAALYDLKQHS